MAERLSDLWHKNNAVPAAVSSGGFGISRMRAGLADARRFGCHRLKYRPAGGTIRVSKSLFVKLSKFDQTCAAPGDFNNKRPSKPKLKYRVGLLGFESGTSQTGLFGSVLRGERRQISVRGLCECRHFICVNCSGGLFLRCAAGKRLDEAHQQADAVGQKEMP